MKKSAFALLVIASSILTIGCASTKTAAPAPAAPTDGKYAVSPEPTSAALPVVAAPPTSSWGGNSLLY